MADVRYKNDTVIVDPGTPTQQLAISAGGAASVNLVASSATVTVDTELTAAAALADATANPTITNIAAMNMVYNGTTWDRRRSAVAALDSTGTGIANAALVGQFDDVATQTVTENQFAHVRISTRRALLVEGVASGTALTVTMTSTTITGTVTVDSELPTAAALADATANPTVPAVGAFLMGWNTTTWDRLRSTTANGLAVDVTRVTGTVTVDTELTTAAALADATANPTITNIASFLMGYNGTTWDRVRTANTGRLQVDIVSGGSADTPTNPVAIHTTIAALAAGSSSTTEHRTTDLGGTTKKLTKIVMWSSVAYKGVVSSVLNNVATTITTIGGAAFQTTPYEPAGGRTGRNYHSVVFSANAGFDGFQVISTNLDASEAADVYVTLYYED